MMDEAGLQRDELTRRLEELEAVHRLGVAVTSTLSVGEIIRTSLSELSRLLDVPQLMLAYFSEDSSFLTVAEVYPEKYRAPGMIGRMVPVGPFEKEVLRTGRPVVGDPSSDRPPEEVRDVIREQNIMSAMLVPMSFRGQVVGMVVLNVFDRVRRFSETEKSLAHTIVSQMGASIQNARLFDRQGSSLREMELLYEMGRRMSAASDMEEILAPVVEYAEEQGLSHATMYRVLTTEDGEPEWANLVARWNAGGVPPLETEDRIHLPESPFTGNWFSDKDHVSLVSNLSETDDLDDGTRSLVEHLGIAATVTIPLVAGGRWVGVLSLLWRSPHEFDERDERMYSAIKDHASITVDNIVLLEETGTTLEEMEQLFEIGRRIGEAATLPDILYPISDYASARGAVYAALLSLELDEDGEPEWANVVTEWFAEGVPRYEELDRRFYLPDFPSARFLIDEKERPQMVSNVAADERLDAQIKPFLLYANINAGVFIPLSTAGRWVGFVAILWNSTYDFDRRDERIYLSYKTQASIAVANLSLLEDTRRMLDDTELLYVMDRRLTAVTTLEEIVAPIVEYSAEKGNVLATLFLLELDEGGNPEWAVNAVDCAIGMEAPYEVGGRLYIPDFKPFELWLADKESLLLIPNVQETDKLDEFSKSALQQVAAAANVTIPLSLGSRWVGLVALFWDTPCKFDRRDERIYMAYRDQASAVLENRLLLERTRESLEEAETLYEMGRRLNVVSGHQDVLDTVVEYARSRGAAYAHLIQLEIDSRGNPDWGVVTASWSAGGPPTFEVGRRFNMADHPETLVWMKGAAMPQFVPNILEDENMTQVLKDVARERDATLAVRIPLSVGGQWVGLITIFWDSPCEFEERDRRIYAAYRDQASVAIRNLMLLEDTRRALDETEELYELGRSLTGVTSMEEILSPLVDYSGKRDASYALLFKIDTDEEGKPEWSTCVAGWAADGTLPFEPGQRSYIPEIEAAGFWTREREHPVFVSDVYRDESIGDLEREFLKSMGAVASVTIPLTVAGRWLGLAIVVWSTPYEFAPGHRRIYSAYRDQASVLMDNISIFELASSRTVRLQAAAEVSRVTTSILDQEELFQSAVNLIRERFDLYYVGIFLVDDAARWAVLRAGTGEAGRAQVERGHKLEVGGQSMIGYTTSTGEPRVALDVGKDAVRFSNPFLPETRSEMALPLISRGEVIGALTVQSTEEAAFGEEEIAVLQTMADQLANAISNARLYEQSRETLREIQDVQRMYVRGEWRDYLDYREEMPGYQYDLSGKVVPSMIRNPEIELAAREGDTVVSGEPDSDGTDIASTMVVPIKLRGEVIGVVGFEELESSREWSEDEKLLVEAIIGQLAQSVENVRLFEQTQKSLANTQALYAGSEAILRSTTPQDIFEAIVVQVQDMGWDQVRVNLFGPDPSRTPEWIRVAYLWNRDSEGALSFESYPVGTVIPADNAVLLQRVYEDKDMLVVEDLPLVEDDLDDVVRASLKSMGVRSMVVAPLVLGNIVYGVSMFIKTTPLKLREEQLRRIKALSDMAATTYQGYRLLEDARRRAERESLIRRVTDRIRGATSVEDILQTTVRELNAALSSTETFVRLGTEGYLVEKTLPGDGIGSDGKKVGGAGEDGNMTRPGERALEPGEDEESEETDEADEAEESSEIKQASKEGGR